VCALINFRKGPVAPLATSSPLANSGERKLGKPGGDGEPLSAEVTQHFHCMEVGKYDDFVDVSRSWTKSDALQTVCGWKEQQTWLYLFDDMLLVHNPPATLNNMWTSSPTPTMRFRKTRSTVFAKVKHDTFGRVLVSEVWIHDLPDSTGTSIIEYIIPGESNT
jgi:hypothetical protein